MQATAMSAGEVSEAAVYACTGNPLPADIAAAVQQLFNDDFRSVFASLADMQVTKGLALTDIVQQLHPCACILTQQKTSCPLSKRVSDLQARRCAQDAEEHIVRPVHIQQRYRPQSGVAVRAGGYSPSACRRPCGSRAWRRWRT
jgi:hypothetical protein